METSEVFKKTSICLLTEAKAHTYCFNLVCEILSAKKVGSLGDANFIRMIDSASGFLEQCLLNEHSVSTGDIVVLRLTAYSKSFLEALTELHQACMERDTTAVNNKLEKLISVTYFIKGESYDY